MKIAVVGNCQARPVGNYMATMCPDIKLLPVTIVHLSGPASEKADIACLDQADVLIAQSVHDGYHAGHLTTSALRERYGSNVIVWPNLFFNGNCADIAYLTSENGERLQGPLGAYHHRLVFECWKNGIAEESAVEFIAELYQQRSSDLIDCVQKSLEELRRRDESSDVKIVDYIATQWQQKRLFFTFNHPTAELLIELGRQLADAAGLIRHREINATSVNEPLDPIVPATNDYIANILGLSYPTDSNYKGIGLIIDQDKIHFNGSEVYSFADLISRSYAAYQAQPSAQLSVRITPNYVAA